MQKSESIKELAIALSKAQGEMKPAVFDSKNPHFGNEFASLTSVHAASHAILSKNGLSVSHTYDQTESGLFLDTTLFHSSGEWISSRIKLILDKPNMQGVGSSTTYAKRFSLAALLALPSESDDDGNQASGVTAKAAKKPEEKKSPPSPMPTQPQIKRLFAICHEANWSEEHLREHMKRVLGIESTKELTWIQYESLCKTIQATPKLKGQENAK